MHIVESGGGCRLLWEAKIEPIELEAFVKESMEGSLVQLEKVLNNSL